MFILLSSGDFDGVFEQVPPGQFKGRKDLRRLGKTHAGDGKQVIQSQPYLALPNHTGNLPGDGADVNARRTHPENGGHELLIGKGGRASLPQLLARAAVLRQVLDIVFMVSMNQSQC